MQSVSGTLIYFVHLEPNRCFFLFALRANQRQWIGARVLCLAPLSLHQNANELNPHSNNNHLYVASSR